MNVVSCNIRNTNPIIFPNNWGMSESASELQRRAEELREDFAGSITLGERLSKRIEGLLQARKDASADNWDGYGAEAIGNESFQNAMRFALSLPVSVPTPEIYIEPDGEVAFEWYEGRRQVFSVSVGDMNRLSYAGLYGVNKTHGVEYLYDDIPESILNNISRLYAGAK